MDKCIVLIGVKHSGKTTAGELLAEQLNLPFFDIDHIIEKQTGKTCRALYSSEGVRAFQKAETEACQFFLEASKNVIDGKNGIKAIVAVGGGICDNIAAIELLHDVAIFVYLEVPNHVAFERILETSKELNSIPATFLSADPKSEEEMREVFYEQYRKRSKEYNSIADITIQTNDMSPAEIAALIIKEQTFKNL